MADVLVVGAGMAGLVGARVLQSAGHRVRVVDKGFNPGGRMASRRSPHDGDPATTPVWDHGAQFVTLREPDLAQETARWRDEGWLVEWFRGSPDLGDRSGAVPDGSTAAGADGHPRYRGAPWMRGLPEALAAELGVVEQRVRLASVRHRAGRWRAEADDGRTWDADAVLVTAPAPQAIDLLGDTPLPAAIGDELARVTFDPCIAVLAVPDRTPDLPEPGAVRFPPGGHDVLQFVSDNQRKGASMVPSVTVHAAGPWSRERLDDDRSAVGAALLAAARPVLGTDGTVRAVQGWRYSVPTSRPDDPAPGGTVPGPIRFAGDAFTGGRVEGAALSGWTAGRRLLEDLG
jgi:hypothetical protein